MATSKKPIPLLVRAKETTPPSTRTGGRLISEVALLRTVVDDLLFLVEDPADGMAYRAAFDTLRASFAQKNYGLLLTQDGDTTSPQAKQTITGSMALLQTWTANGISSDTTPDHTTDKITVDEAGIYEVDLTISFSGTLSKTFQFEVYHNDISASPNPTATGIKLERKMGTGGDVGSASLTGIVSLAANDAIMLYVKSTDGGTDIVVHQAQLEVVQI